jgi:hypothetical protein
MTAKDKGTACAAPPPCYRPSRLLVYVEREALPTTRVNPRSRFAVDDPTRKDETPPLGRFAAGCHRWPLGNWRTLKDCNREARTLNYSPVLQRPVLLFGRSSSGVRILARIKSLTHANGSGFFPANYCTLQGNLAGSAPLQVLTPKPFRPFPEAPPKWALKLPGGQGPVSERGSPEQARHDVPEGVLVVPIVVPKFHFLEVGV